MEQTEIDELIKGWSRNGERPGEEDEGKDCIVDGRREAGRSGKRHGWEIRENVVTEHDCCR